jgi:hypothetical protein
VLQICSESRRSLKNKGLDVSQMIEKRDIEESESSDEEANAGNKDDESSEEVDNPNLNSDESTMDHLHCSDTEE